MEHRWRFVVGKYLPPEQWKRDGKCEWPNLLDLELSRYEALDLVGRLVAQLQREHETIDVSLPGELSENPDEPKKT